MPEFEYIYSNLRQAMRFFGEATGKGEVRQLEGALAIYSGMEYGVFNIAILDSHLPDPQKSLEACAKYFSAHARRWSVWLCEDSLSSAGLREARAALSRNGLREISTAPGMTAEILAPPRRELPAIECVAVTDQWLRDAFGSVAATCFDIPIGVAREVYYPERAWDGAYRGFVGMVAGRPLGIVALVENDATLGVYSLATLPEDRRLGYGEALLRAAVEQARQDMRVERLVLQSSEAGHALYRRMGFRETTRFSVYLTK
ncbi:MAG: GNAT family N-acetyltransferase [Acidobacteriota bacterium]